jgi:hypothetical protein
VTGLCTFAALLNKQQLQIFLMYHPLCCAPSKKDCFTNDNARIAGALHNPSTTRLRVSQLRAFQPCWKLTNPQNHHYFVHA